ncbi:MAG: polysaccharide deacetylase family protein [Cyanobacteria bacterium J06560_6]
MFSLFRKSKVCVLMFHGVRGPQKSKETHIVGPENHVSSAFFESVIQAFLANRFQPLSLKEAIINYTKAPSFVITLDDGFRDNLYVVLPILERYQLPATIYVTSGFVDNSVIPFEYRLASIINNSQTILLDEINDGAELSISEKEEKKEIYHLVKKKLKYSTNSVRTKLLDRLSHLEKENLSVEYLSVEELKKLASSPLITIGSHTHFHHALPAMSYPCIFEDIQLSKRLLESWTNNPIVDFSFPYGASNKKIGKMLRGMGFCTAVTTKSGFLEPPAPFYRMDIPRVEINSLEHCAFIVNGLSL